ncbi:MAG TPA: hypothetical protein PKA13_07635 [Geminicoccaceae bacterium]|nr:hypothetical protein [Geminicoccus sp.]HMU49630.1 hypothetical protein [Geminicoccaceae bacterium]
MSTEPLPIVEWSLPVGRPAAVLRLAEPVPRPRPTLVWSDTVPPGTSETGALPAEPRAAASLSFDEADLARACAAAARDAACAARDEHAATIATQDRLTVERLERALARADGMLQARLSSLAAGLTEAFAAALEASGLLRAGRAASLESMLRSTFAETLGAPSLRLTLAPGTAAALRDPLARLLAGTGVGDRIELAAGPLPDRLSLRIDWQDGWAEGDLDHVERLLTEHLTAEAAAMSAPAPASIASEDEP